MMTIEVKHMRDTIDMAREAGFTLPSDEWLFSEMLKRFEALVRADEREQCAQICESLFDMDDDSCSEAEQCAAAIRARKDEQ